MLAFSLAFSCLLSDDTLSQEYKEWLEIASPIITKTEKEIFSKLKSDEERNRFIQAFWKQRDPLPDTQENEFYLEYMKRIRFADLQFGRETSKRGSQTERGYFYLLLGPPLDRQMYTTQSDLNPLELWHYQGDQEHGLPPYFYLIFYQPQGMGEFRLYSPGMEGPEWLVSPNQQGRGLSRASAYQIIKNISGELAGASLSYLPGDAILGETSFSSDTIISSIRSLPEKKFSDTYAANFLAFKDYVETDYTHNYVNSHHKVKVFKNGDQYFIHWTLEPDKINFVFYNNKYYASYQLIMRIEDSTGNLIFEMEEEIPLSLTPENYKKHEHQHFAFQDILPVIPGNSKIFVLLKNKTTKDFTSFQAEINVPPKKSGALLSNLLLYNDLKKLEGTQKTALKAFSFGENQYITTAQDNFSPNNEIGIYCQVYNIKEHKGKSIQFEIYVAGEETPVHSQKKPLSEFLGQGQLGVDSGLISLVPFKPGYYKAEVSILDEEGRKILSERENFILLSQPFLTIPWTYSKLHNPMPNVDYLFILATQYFMTRNYRTAKDTLNEALKIKDEPRGRLLLGKTLYALGQYQESLAVSVPVFQLNQDKEAAKIISINYVALKDWASALVYLEKLLEQAAEISVLNLAAECYINLNQPEKAQVLIRKSLELNPDQEEVKKLEKKAKEKK